MATYPYPFEYFGEAGFSEGPSSYEDPRIPWSTVYNESIDGIENRHGVGWYKGEWASLTQTKIFDVDTVVDIQFKQGWVGFNDAIDIEFYIDDMNTPYASWRPTAFTTTLSNVIFSAGLHTIKLKVTNNEGTLTHTGDLNYRQFRILNYNVISETLPSYTLSGYVYNNESISIKNATVTINDTELLTNQDGYYESTVESGTYNLSTSKECYSEDSASVIVTDANVTQDFVIDCIECEICPTCPPDKLNWWLLVVGGIAGHLLKRSKKDNKR